MPSITEEKLEACRHCLIGTVVLETEARNMSPMLGGRPDIKKTYTCYCDSCGTLFHAPTMIAQIAAKKPQPRGA